MPDRNDLAATFAAAHMLGANDQQLPEDGPARLLIPTVKDGGWDSVEQLLALHRTVAQHDLASGLVLGPSALAGPPVGSGSAKQQARVAELLRSAGPALAAEERAAPCGTSKRGLVLPEPKGWCWAGASGSASRRSPAARAF
jgi:hypothetical protein